MATLLHRLGKTAYRRWPFFIAAWLIAFVAVGVFAGTMSKPMTDEVRAAFVAGGPTGHLIDDLVVLADGILDAHDVAREDVERAKRIIVTEPRLVLVAHERFESILNDFADLILEREGDRIDAASARLLIRLIVAMFEVSMSTFLCGDDDRPVLDLFHENLRTARTLLA